MADVCFVSIYILGRAKSIAAHKLSIEALLGMLGRRFMLNHSWQIISLHPFYLGTLLRSNKKSQYLSIFDFFLNYGIYKEST